MSKKTHIFFKNLWYECHNYTDRVLHVVVYFYRPPTKVREGNVFVVSLCPQRGGARA